MRYILIFFLFVAFSCSSDTPANPSDLGRDLHREMDVSTPSADLKKGEDLPIRDLSTMDADQDLGEGCLPRHDHLTPEGHPSDGWVWEKGGRIFEVDPEPAKATQGDFSPSVVKLDKGYRLYFARRRDKGWEIWTSLSDDGKAWQTPEPVQGLDGHNVLSADYRNGEVRIWFGSGSFSTAKSVDGVNFTDQVSRILSPSDVGDFGKLSLLDPKVWVDEEGYLMWFGGFDGATFRIGKASSKNGVVWNSEPSTVLESTGADRFDSTSVASPQVKKYGDRWYMWYGGYDTSKTDPGPWRIGLATSVDGMNWERKGVTIPLSEMGDDMWSTRDASVYVGEDGKLAMVYVGMSDDSHYRLLSASTASCF